MARAIAIGFVAAWTSVAMAQPALVKVHGRVVDKATNEPLAGVTVIGQLPTNQSTTAITDDTGAFDIDVSLATNQLTYYYSDTTVEQRIVVLPGFGRLDLGTYRLEVKPYTGSSFYSDPGFILDYTTAFVETFDGSWPVVRSRDVDGLIPLVAASRPRMPTMLDGGRRLGGAPAVALGLLEEVDVYTMRGGDSLDGRADGVALASRAGSNENHGDARLGFGNDGLALEAGAGGPIAHDTAWWWAGTALGDGIEQALAKINYAHSPEQQGQIVALHQVDPPVLSIRATTTTTAATDDWANAAWVSKWNDNKVQLTTGATGERLDDGLVDTTRVAARAELVDRFKIAGYQVAKAYGEVGGGELGDIHHRDAAASARDRWSLTPNFTVEGSVRWDERWFGASHTQVWQPQGVIGWDWTKEGRSEVFVSGGRASLLDDYALGGWTDNPRSRDDLATGVRYELTDSWIGGIAVRDSDTSGTRRTGIDATLDHRKRWFELHVTATSVERAVAGWGRLTFEHVLVSANGRWAAADDPLGSFAGASLAWRHRFNHRIAGTLGGEVIRDREGSLGRAVATFSY
ncbi:MAG TPA: hypothetical protein VGO00_04165 [Kofleriaceae bacterium]|nr:hypothetical protein [Kofleriaceae bacterium]